jgi:hypothetical protein
VLNLESRIWNLEFEIPMHEPYSTALAAALAFCAERTAPLGIVAAGSVLRGEGDANSDLDLYVLHAATWRQRVQRRFNGVPCEIFINSAATVREYFVEDNRDGRPMTAHMLATGQIVAGADDATLRTLIDEARAWLIRPPALDAEALTARRYMIACSFEDAFDIAARDPAMAALLLGEAVPAALAYAFLARGLNIPRHKDLLTCLGGLPDGGVLHVAALAFATTDAWPARLAAAQLIADHALGARGFFEWESSP